MMTECFILADKLDEWKSGLDTIRPAQAEFEKWLFLQASGPLLGGKTGELIVVREGQFDLSLDEQMEYAERLCALWSVGIRELYRNAFSCKFMIYRENLLDHKLAETPRRILCRLLNYAPDVKAGGFLRELSQRWQLTGSVPHEIGIALGYPLKDVWGFMGLSPQKFSGCCGWQIFGDPEPSVNQSRRYRNAHREALRFLDTDRPVTPEQITVSLCPITQ
jgi:hypothetical protein